MKRKRKTHHEQTTSKRQKSSNGEFDPPTWPLLLQYFPKVLTLRNYLASRFSKQSRRRQKKLLHYGVKCGPTSNNHVDESVVQLLDSITVATSKPTTVPDAVSIDQDITVFTQQLSSSTEDISPTQGALKQSEIVDFTIWQLFRRHLSNRSPSHILCRGYQNYAAVSKDSAEVTLVPGIPGVWSNSTNPHVQTLKSHPWCALHSLLGKGAESIISEMLLECAIFQPVEDSSNLIQLSGVPLSDLTVLRATPPTPLTTASKDDRPTSYRHLGTAHSRERGLSDIRFVRSRMLYAKPMLTAKSNIRFGISHVHALNNNSGRGNNEQTVRVLKYFFPRQFGLHNVFTSDVDPNDTAQPFKDYTLRDKEIADLNSRRRRRNPLRVEGEQVRESSLPKRLQGELMTLVARLHKRHQTCSYAALLQHYCPSSLDSSTEPLGPIRHATSSAQVSAFCRNAMLKVFPSELWGADEVRAHNLKVVMRSIDKFIYLRRYETLSLHDVLQNVKIHGISWLAPRDTDLTSKLSATDFAKRKELMAELTYYLFDSFLIPLIRGHFHVTESGAHRNQLFYFRHDVWRRAISEPGLASLKSSVLEVCNAGQVRKELVRRSLGISQVRLLPKEQGTRPIINLRRRTQRLQNGRLVLRRSINSILTPTFSALNYEKSNRPEMLGSALFSVEDMYPRLQAFRKNLEQQGVLGQPLYFAKVDVKACFDTIPQKRLMTLARSILGTDEYQITKYARAKLVGGDSKETPGFGAKPSWRYLTKATAGHRDANFQGEIEADSIEGRTRTVYIDGVVRRLEQRKAILQLLEEHVESNFIKLGNRFYRQKQGIPQGSIVSSLLCSYFYAELERQILHFVKDGESLLLRLIDDFLLISTNRKVAERFMHDMHGGVPEFGLEVKAEKSRTNFDMEIDGRMITRLPSETSFPYCGNAINTVTLDLSKDRERRKTANIADSTNIEYSKLPGQTFYRKTLNALKLQMQAMLLSTAYNSFGTVLSNLHHTFTEVAQKSYHYIRSLPSEKQPPRKLVIKTFDDVIKLACMLMKRCKRTSKDVLPYECRVSNAQARWLACNAFQNVFQPRQTKYTDLLAWLKNQLAMPSLRAQTRELEAVVGRKY